MPLIARQVKLRLAYSLRQKLQAELLGDCHHPRNVLLLLRRDRADRLKEPLETRRRFWNMMRPVGK